MFSTYILRALLCVNKTSKAHTEQWAESPRTKQRKAKPGQSNSIFFILQSTPYLMILPPFFSPKDWEKLRKTPVSLSPLPSFLTKRENGWTAFQSFLAKVNGRDWGCWEWVYLQCSENSVWSLTATASSTTPSSRDSQQPNHLPLLCSFLQKGTERDGREIKQVKRGASPNMHSA